MWFLDGTATGRLICQNHPNLMGLSSRIISLEPEVLHD
jgi:hypothetical protein